MKKHSDFVHLHLHTQYSLLDGACKLDDVLTRASEYRMPAAAITDHGNMFGAIEFYQKAIHKGVKPIIGCEVYVAPDSRFEKSSRGIQEASFHLVLLAKDEVGYKNLMKLVSIGYLEGFYYRPRVDKEALAKYNDGLIAMSACLKGEVAHLIISGDLTRAKRTADEYRHIFGKGNFYIEVQDNLIKEQETANRELIKIAKDLELPLVATNDVHYLDRDDSKAHEALLCIQTQTTLDDPNRMRFQTDEFYFKTGDIMKRTFGSLCPEAVTNTVEIAEKCNLELDFSKPHLPHFTPPEGVPREGYLRSLVEKGLARRYPDVTPALKDRLEHELKVIEQSGYVSYFLIVWDFVNYARSQGISVGPGRGSAAGSVVSYSLGITDIDPMKYDLLFERFLNPARITLPDIDIDFCFERRNEVIEYVVNKYSKENVAQIITFGTMMAKGVIRDVGRVLGLPYAEVDRIAKLIPNDLNITLEDAMNAEPELKSLYKTDPRMKQLIDISKRLEGLTRHASTHAAGVVIAEKPLDNYVPLFKTNDDMITTGYAMKSLEEIKLLKMDFLGLKTLTVIEQAVKIIKRTKGADVVIGTIPKDDPAAFKLLSDAETTGVFQLESSGMKDLLKKLKPERFEDIITLIALYRPGPIGSGMLDDYMHRRHGQVKVKYDHPLLEPILKDTYGIIVFQEQVMMIASQLAGFSLADADNLRRAMGKKTPEVMAEARKDFIEGCVKTGVERPLAEKIFGLIEYFAGYGFNKSHSAAYALISYQTAYLKANYPVEFMAALLTSEKDKADKLSVALNECLGMGIKILPPDVNESYSQFTVVGESIRFGLAAVKNVGQGAIDSVITARETHGKFTSLYEFTELVDSRLVNRKVLEALIKCGAFDTLGLFRSQLLAIADNAIEIAGGIQKDKVRGQLSFFDTFEHEDTFKKTVQDVPNIPEWPESQLLAYEKELLGFYITKHPLARYAKILKMYSSCPIQDFPSRKDGDEILVGGIMSKVKITVTKKAGEKMAIVTFEDLTNSCEVLVFPNAYKNTGSLVRTDAIVFIRGKISLREDEPRLIASDIILPEDVKDEFTKAVVIGLSVPGLDDLVLDSLKETLKRYPGKVPVYFNFIEPTGERTSISLGKDFNVQPTEKLVDAIEAIIGQETVNFQVSI
ncbi:MAG: DNA polymerase III subunit alpha [Candidatus Omnitrophica bacterium]|nr:DNA polymerase III subunit alpha [Candidatus Omnitrophota bacterium]